MEQSEHHTQIQSQTNAHPHHIHPPLCLRDLDANNRITEEDQSCGEMLPPLFAHFIQRPHHKYQFLGAAISWFMFVMHVIWTGSWSGIINIQPLPTSGSTNDLQTPICSWFSPQLGIMEKKPPCFSARVWNSINVSRF